jgi:hypothetical protein
LVPGVRASEISPNQACELQRWAAESLVRPRWCRSAEEISSSVPPEATAPPVATRSQHAAHRNTMAACPPIASAASAPLRVTSGPNGMGSCADNGMRMNVGKSGGLPSLQPDVRVRPTRRRHPLVTTSSQPDRSMGRLPAPTPVRNFRLWSELLRLSHFVGRSVREGHGGR